MQNTVTNNIFKSFGFADADDYIERGMSTTDAIRKGIVEFDDEICKAVYADTAENRKLGRVGQEYHKGRKKQGGMEEPQGNSGGGSHTDDSNPNSGSGLSSEQKTKAFKEMNNKYVDKYRSALSEVTDKYRYGSDEYYFRIDQAKQKIKDEYKKEMSALIKKHGITKDEIKASKEKPMFGFNHYRLSK